MTLRIEDYEFDDESPLNPNDYEIDDTPTGLPDINEPTTVTPPNQPGGIQIPDAVKSAAQLAYTPVRGTRGIGVGIQKLFAGVNPAKLMLLPQLLGADDFAKIASNADDALQSSAAAMQPGYVPQEGEKLGAFLGEAAGAAGLMAPVAAAAAPAAAALGATSPLAVAGVTGAIDATAGMGLSALQQASEKGAISPGEVALTGTISGAIPFAKPGYEFVKRAGKKILPELLEKTANMSSKGVARAIKDPKLTLPIGEAEAERAVEQRVSEIQTRLLDLRKAAGEANRKVKMDLGLEVAPDEEIALLAERGDPMRAGAKEILEMSGKLKPQSATAFDELMSNINVQKLKASGAIGDDLAAIQGAAGQQAQKAPSVLSPQQIAEAFESRLKVPESQRLKYLYELKKQANEYTAIRPGVVKTISSKEEALMAKLAKQADAEMTSLPGGARLKESNATFSKIADIYDDLQRKIQDPGQAEDTLVKLFRGDINVLSRGRAKDTKAALAKLDEMAGEPLTEKLWDALTTQMFQKKLGRGIGTYFVGQTGIGQALSDLFQGNIGSAIGKTVGSLPLVSPRAAGFSIRTAAAADPYVQRFLSTISNPKLRSAIISAIATPKERKK